MDWVLCPVLQIHDAFTHSLDFYRQAVIHLLEVTELGSEKNTIQIWSVNLTLSTHVILVAQVHN